MSDLEREAEELFAEFLIREEEDGFDLSAAIEAAAPRIRSRLRVLAREHRRIQAGLRFEDDEDGAIARGLRGPFAARLESLHGPGVDPQVELEVEGPDELAEADLDRLSVQTTSSSRYRLKGEVAHGGMGAVLRVWDENLRRHLAMKVLVGPDAIPSRRGASPAHRSQLIRFLEEAQVTGQLDHPGIVPVHELGLDAEGRAFFTMKLVKGQTLGEVFAQLAREQGGWSQTRVLGLIQRVCEAMSYAHAKGVIHRDLKPSNVMVGRFGEVYVMDWGLAKIVGREDEKDIRIRPEDETRTTISGPRERAGQSPESPLCTMDGDVVGTPAYMSPEQAAGRIAEMGPASDVYAVGAILYHLLAGQTPYLPPRARVSPYALLMRVQEGPPRPLSELAPHSPAELIAICEKAMERASEDRYPDMQALASDLAAYIEGRVVRAYETGAWAEARKWVQRNRGLSASLASAVLLLVLGLIASIVLRQWAVAAADREKASKDEVFRLSALQDYGSLIGRADELWPPHPENLEGLRAWIGDARELAAELPRHRSERERVRGRALALPGSGAGSEGSGWRFPDTPEGRGDSWWHASLTELFQSLESLEDADAGLLSEVVGAVSPGHGWSVPRRLAFSERLRDALAQGGEWHERWRETIGAIRDHPAYGGLELGPQVGLVPIHADPDSGLWEFWHVASGDAPALDEGAGRIVPQERSGLVMVLIPGDSFWRGAQELDPSARNYDPSALDDERPVRELRLSPFFLSKYEMTQGQWLRLTGANPSAYSSHALEVTLIHPVEQVTWNEAILTLDRFGLELPTEAQWEYAARAGTDTPWWTGARVETLVQPAAANLSDAAASRAHARWAALRDPEELDDGYPVHAPVGSFRANAFGLHDVLGNTMEWCLDGYLPSFYRSCPSQDPVASPEETTTRVARGGSFKDPAVFARVTYRFDAPTLAEGSIGLRPARRLDF